MNFKPLDQRKAVCLSLTGAVKLAEHGAVLLRKDGYVIFDEGHAQDKQSKAQMVEYKATLKSMKTFNMDKPLLEVMSTDKTNTFVLPNVFTNGAFIIQNVREKFILDFANEYVDVPCESTDGFKPGKFIVRSERVIHAPPTKSAVSLAQRLVGSKYYQYRRQMGSQDYGTMPGI